MQIGVKNRTQSTQILAEVLQISARPNPSIWLCFVGPYLNGNHSYLHIKTKRSSKVINVFLLNVVAIFLNRFRESSQSPDFFPHKISTSEPLEICHVFLSMSDPTLDFGSRNFLKIINVLCPGLVFTLSGFFCKLLPQAFSTH